MLLTRSKRIQYPKWHQTMNRPRNCLKIFSKVSQLVSSRDPNMRLFNRDYSQWTKTNVVLLNVLSTRALIVKGKGHQRDRLGRGETGTDFSSTYDLYYDPPTHLREGNVFIRVCLSTFKHGTSETPLAMAPSDTGPPLRHGTSRTPTPARPHWWHLMPITGQILFFIF